MSNKRYCHKPITKSDYGTCFACKNYHDYSKAAAFLSNVEGICEFDNRVKNVGGRLCDINEYIELKQNEVEYVWKIFYFIFYLYISNHKRIAHEQY